ncbi:MAG: TIR domain-containing protein, partial [Verrucomicrobia bacterium]|nr:TIR domain-containing protein [Verrucomicrobiota bacterium]
MSGQIFISYRREESRWSARSLHDRLCRDFDPKQIFMDIDAIPLGEDFVEAIETTVGKCDVLIAVIGKNWLISNDDQGNRRLDNPEDFVRMEIGAALKRKIRVIPVLLDGALMPRADELPEDLKPLVRRNALPITETSFEGDLHRLTGAITQALEKAEKERLEAAQRQREEKERLETAQRQREKKERLEAERRQREEKERLEAERRQREEKERLEAAQRQREEKERLEAERRQREEKERLEAAQRQREKKERLEAAQRQREEKERLAPRALPLKALADMIKRTLRESSWRLVLALGFLAFVGIGSYALYRYLHVHTVPKVLFGELTVLSDPPGAAITLDEGPPLKAPHTFSDVKFGAHQLTATLKDFEPLSQTIEVRSGMNPEIHLPLTPGKEIAALSVQSEP